MRKCKFNNLISAGQFYGGEIEPGTFHGADIEAGTFCGGEIEPGTFHCGEIEPGTFHNSCHAQDIASKADDEEPKKVVKESGSDAESSEEAETSSGNGESQD